MMLPMVVLGALTVCAGFLLLDPFYTLLGADGGFHWTPLGIGGLVLALSGIGLAYWQVRNDTGVAALQPVGALIQSAPLDRLYERLWYGVLLVVGRAFAWVDRYVIDGFINWIGWACVCWQTEHVECRRDAPITTSELLLAGLWPSSSTASLSTACGEEGSKWDFSHSSFLHR